MATQKSGLETAIDLLTRDHDEVRNMFRDYKKLMDNDAPDSQREALAARICNALTVHAQIEEEIFYPAAREAMAEDAEEIMDHADVEHGSMKELIAQIEGSSADDAHFDAKVHVLGEYVAHHVCEEEDEMFSELRQAEADFDEVAKRMQARRAQIESELDAMAAKADGKPARASSRATPKAQPAKRTRTSRGAARKQVRSGGSKKPGTSSTRK